SLGEALTDSSQTNEAFVSPVYKVNANVTDIALRLKKSETEAAETKEKLKTLTEEHGLLKKNIASFIRKKEEE
ncbi:MAG: hypothetical protein NTY44_12930, partial [Deltaproteobacteria bacterium]|nr:hypothetical protein [Deltaproteobacteria bacterium]